MMNSDNKNNRKTEVYKRNQDTEVYKRNQDAEVNNGDTLKNHEDDKSKRTKIDVNDLVDGFLIGELLTESGGEADLHLCTKDGQTYIAKIYRKNSKYGVELDVFKKIMELNSPYLLTPIAIGRHKGRFYEIQPYLKNGTAKDNLELFTEDYLISTFIPQISEAIRIIHELDIIHNDITPKNIFLSNDKQRVILGDFGISKSLYGADFITSDGRSTIGFSPPEMPELISKPGDYYYFGRTLLYLSLKYDEFEGLEKNQIQRSIMMNGTKIHDEINEEIHDLIFGLTIHTPNKRFGDNQIKKWLKNPRFFRQQRIKLENINITENVNAGNIEYTFSVNNKKEYFYNYYDLGVAMLTNLDLALSHFENDLLSKTLEKYDPDDANKAKIIHAKYFKPGDKLRNTLGLYVTLYSLEKKLPIIFDQQIFDSFGLLVNYLIDKHPFQNQLFASDDFLQFVIMPRIAENAQKRLQRIIDSVRDNKRINLILSYFASSEVLLIGKQKYNNLRSFTQTLFTNNKENVFAEDCSLFYEMLINIYKLPQDKIQEIRAIPNNWEKYAQLVYLINGRFYFNISNVSFGNLSEFLDILASYYQQKQSLEYQQCQDFITKGRYLQIGNIEKSLTDEMKKNLQNTNNLVDFIYYNFNGKKPYYGANSVEELIDIITESDNFIQIQLDILNDPVFNIWLKSLNFNI